MVLENLSPSERRGIALFFIATCLALVAWAFPNMSRVVTIPGAVLCLLAAVYFLWPEIKSLVFRQRLAVVAGLGLLLCIILGGTSLYLSPHRAALPEPTSPSPLQQSSPLAPLPPLPIQSRFDRFIFACDVPLPKTPEEDAKQKEALKDNIQAWADTIGVSASFADIKNGTQQNQRS